MYVCVSGSIRKEPKNTKSRRKISVARHQARSHNNLIINTFIKYDLLNLVNKTIILKPVSAIF